ncbi:MAG TPA: hypothetical protein VGG41_19180 [Solirubrobacteraceae bacterium]|jgi:hypothetical protein
MGTDADQRLRAVIGFRIYAIELLGLVRLILADREPLSLLAPGDGTPRRVYRISIESPFHVSDTETDTLIAYQPWNNTRPSGLNELAELFRATIDEATGVWDRSLTLKLTTQHAQKRVLQLDGASGYEAWRLEGPMT